MKRYTVLYERGRRNWSAYVPDLPGCVATGKTRAVTARRMREAIRMHLEALSGQGEAIPEAMTEAGTVSITIQREWRVKPLTHVSRVEPALQLRRAGTGRL